MKKDNKYWKEAYENMSLAHTEVMVRWREVNMAFDELLERTPSETIREAFYELKELKIKNKPEKRSKDETTN